MAESNRLVAAANEPHDAAPEAARGSPQGAAEAVQREAFDPGQGFFPASIPVELLEEWRHKEDLSQRRARRVRLAVAASLALAVSIAVVYLVRVLPLQPGRPVATTEPKAAQSAGPITPPSSTPAVPQRPRPNPASPRPHPPENQSETPVRAVDVDDPPFVEKAPVARAAECSEAVRALNLCSSQTREEGTR